LRVASRVHGKPNVEDGSTLERVGRRPREGIGATVVGVTVEPLVLSVAIEREAPDGQVSAVESVLAHYGIGANVKAVMERRSTDVLPWLIEIAVVGPIDAFFLSFGSTFGRTPAKVAYPLVKEWIEALWAARADSGTGEGSIEIVGTGETTLLVNTGIPDGALDALADIEWDRVSGHYLTWDDTTGKWCDPTGST
jgi:hypothetical protein